MKQQCQNTAAHRDKTTDLVISRRSALGSSGLAVLALLSDSALGQAENKDADAKRPSPRPPKEFREGMEKWSKGAENSARCCTMTRRPWVKSRPSSRPYAPPRSGRRKNSPRPGRLCGTS